MFYGISHSVSEACQKLSRPIVIVTGGYGYIGSHVAVELLAAGYSVIALDNLSNSYESTEERIKKAYEFDLNRSCSWDEFFRYFVGIHIDLYTMDISTVAEFLGGFSEKIIGIIHCAGYKAVGESCSQTIPYFDNNVIGTRNLLEVMHTADIKNLVFSSSATVYVGEGELAENDPKNAVNPYGSTKMMCEKLIEDSAFFGSVYRGVHKTITAISLRYFNPIGAHDSGHIGENPKVLNNIVPILMDYLRGKRENIVVFGDDYATPDGTCRRDYVAIRDLARAHVAAIRMLSEGATAYPALPINIGYGFPLSVKELIEMTEAATERTISYGIGPRREGDKGEFRGNIARQSQLLGVRSKTPQEVREVLIAAIRAQYTFIQSLD